MHQVFIENIALKPRLKCSARTRRGEFTDLHGAGFARLETFIRENDVGLLFCHLGMLLGHGRQSLSLKTTRFRG